MSVFEALQIVMNALEKQSGCGRLDEPLRKARTTLYLYVTKKLEEEGQENDTKE